MRRYRLRIIFLLIAVVAFFSAWWVFSDYRFAVISILTFNVLLFLWGDGDIANPCVWCPPFITLYNCSILVLDYLGIRVVAYHNELLLMNFLALLGFFVSCFFIEGGSLKGQAGKYRKIDVDKLVSIKLLALVSVFFSIYVVISFFLANVSVKSDFDGGLTSFFRIFLFCYVCILLNQALCQGKNALRYVFLACPFFLFSAVALGERDVFFSFAVTSIFILYISGMGGRITYYVVGAMVLMMIPVLGEYKNFFTRNDFSGAESSGYLVGLLNGEFRSAGFNNEVIISHFNGPLFLGESIIRDLLRSVVPGFIMTFENSVGWYNSYYHSDIVSRGRGYGFSLAAEGYINFKYYGVFLWFFVYGSVLSLIYNAARRNVYALAIYVCSVPVFIYSLRGDFSTLFSPLFKTMLLPIAFIFLVSFFISPYKIKRKAV